MGLSPPGLRVPLGSSEPTQFAEVFHFPFGGSRRGTGPDQEFCNLPASPDTNPLLQDQSQSPLQSGQYRHKWSSTSRGYTLKPWRMITSLRLPTKWR